MASPKRSDGTVAVAAFVVLLLAAVAAAPLGAQAYHGRELSVLGGASSFDASGTGTASTAAVRVAQPLGGRWVLVEGSLAYAALDEQFSPSRTRVGVAEAQLQLQLPAGRLRPYVGLGGGVLRYLSNASGRPATPGTVSGAAGLRVRIASRIGARGELRVRGWEQTQSGGFGFVNSAAEYTGGLTYSF